MALSGIVKNLLVVVLSNTVCFELLRKMKKIEPPPHTGHFVAKPEINIVLNYVHKYNHEKVITMIKYILSLIEEYCLLCAGLKTSFLAILQGLAHLVLIHDDGFVGIIL